MLIEALPLWKCTPKLKGYKYIPIFVLKIARILVCHKFTNLKASDLLWYYYPRFLSYYDSHRSISSSLSTILYSTPHAPNTSNNNSKL